MSVNGWCISQQSCELVHLARDTTSQMHGLRARSPELVCSPGPCLNAGQPHVVFQLWVMSCLLCSKLTGKKVPGGGLAMDMGQGSPQATGGFLSDSW